jgi:hypothetical protein
MVDCDLAILTVVIAQRVGRVPVSEMNIARTVGYDDRGVPGEWIRRVRLLEDSLVATIRRSIEVDLRAVEPSAIAVLTGPARASPFEPDKKFVPCTRPDEKRILSTLGANRVCTRAQHIPAGPQLEEARQSRGVGARPILCRGRQGAKRQEESQTE